VLLVASSDLSHYEDARTAAAMDAVVMRPRSGLLIRKA
jgi:AmmeMemoRadiSam system protein B